VHYTSTNVSHWKFEGWVRRDEEGYDSAVTRLANGRYLLVSVQGAPLESDDLYTWRPSNNSIGAVDEGAHFSRFSGALWLNVEPRCGPPGTPDWTPRQGRFCNPNVRKSTDGGISWQAQSQLLFKGPGERVLDHFWAFQGPLVPQQDGEHYVLYFTQVKVNTSLEPGVFQSRSMLQVAKVNERDGAVTADRNASFLWVMQPPDEDNRDRGPVRARTATTPLAIAEEEAMVIAAAELERWVPYWHTGGRAPIIASKNGTLVATTQLLFRDPVVVRACFTEVKRTGTGAETRWQLELATGCGQRYGFVLAGNGTILYAENRTDGAARELTPLRQFMRLDPTPGT